MVQYLQFRILEFPLIGGLFSDLCKVRRQVSFFQICLSALYGKFSPFPICIMDLHPPAGCGPIEGPEYRRFMQIWGPSFVSNPILVPRLTYTHVQMISCN